MAKQKVGAGHQRGTYSVRMTNIHHNQKVSRLLFLNSKHTYFHGLGPISILKENVKVCIAPWLCSLALEIFPLLVGFLVSFIIFKNTYYF